MSAAHQAGGSRGGILVVFNQVVTVNGGTISGNTAFGNGGALAVGGGSVHLSGLTIRSNTATGSGGAFHVSGGTLTANFNRIVYNSAANGRGVAQTGGIATLTNNWWGTNAPTALMSGLVGFTPWLQLAHAANPNQVFVPNSTTLTATFLTNSAGTFVPAANLSTLIGLPITFNNPVRGILSGAQTTIQTSGTATVTFTANTTDAGSANAVVDGQIATASIIILAPPQLSIVRAGTNVVLSWPAVFPSFVLQFTPELLPSPFTDVWTTYSGPLATNGRNFYATNSVGASNRFFRLAH